jgi:hypothetical protein
MSRTSSLLKLELLSHGIRYDSSFLSEFGQRFDLLEKRRAYGTSDTILFDKTLRVPQEIILQNNIVCAVNFSASSTWRLEFQEGEAIVTDGVVRHTVDFPKRPAFYGAHLGSGERIEEIVTLYGTSTLGIFSLGHCYYFNDDRECRFCSLGPARNYNSDHRIKVQDEQAREAVAIALSMEPERIQHILLNGGTGRDYDIAFANMASVLAAACDAPGASALERHMISMPPKDFSLFDRLASLDATLAMSLEIWDENLFTQICPGKAQDYGRMRFIQAYEAAVSSLGNGNVYVGFVAGLEPIDSLIEGMYAMAERGVVPAVAVFHPDAGSKFSNHSRPKPENLLEIGHHMARIYKEKNFRPLITNSGRNSLDTEAYYQYLA